MGKRITPSLHSAATWWTDDASVTHICESAAPLNNELLIWTLCDREVETGAAFIAAGGDHMSCSKCAAAEGVLTRRRARSDLHPAPVR